MKKTYIFGHKKPDTDSTMSAIALSYLKNCLKENTEPRVLGTTNKETKYALKYFDVEEPKYLNDVKLQLKDVNYHKNFFLNEVDSIYDGYQLMLKEELTGLPITKENGDFLGLITIKDLSRTFLNEDGLELNTSYKNLLKVLKAEEITKFDDEINGELLVASYRSTTFMKLVNLDPNMILIVGDRHSIIEYAVKSKVKLIIVVGSGEIKDAHIKIAKENHVNIIRTDYDTYHSARLVSFANYVKTMIGSYNPTKFDQMDYVDDVLEINHKLRHTNYPIVNKYNKCLGLLRITDLNDKDPKQVILVDHNEKMQSADGIEEAVIKEIVDHHNLGSITTNIPINFRNMAVGSTCTIVYTLFKEREIEIPKKIAGCLLSGILSDTLILRSPTATKKDIEAVQELSKIAEVDYEDYGMELLKAGTSLDGMSKEDVLYNDFKLYTVNDDTFAIGQFFTTNFDEIEKEINEYIEVLDKVASANNYDLVALYVTDIIKNGSYIIFNHKGQSKLDLAYDMEVKEGCFIPECVSRKKHVVPLIMDVYEN